MTQQPHLEQIQGLQTRVGAFAQSDGESACKAVESQSAPLVRWLGYLHNYHVTGVADSLLVATGSSIREAAGCLCLGLVRPALFSLRAQIDLMLAWLYFKDHPIEWKLVNRTGDGFKMKKDILEYLSGHYPGFKARIGILKLVRTREDEEPYRLLSAHIHGQSEVVLPSVHSLSDLVGTSAQALDASNVCFEVAEYLSDVLVAAYASEWEAIPAEIRTSVSGRFTSDGQKKDFFC